MNSAARAQVQALLAGGQAPAAAALDGADALAWAWAFKDACYEAWTRDPSQARHCANWLAELAAAAPEPAVCALAAWTRGIAELAEGGMDTALQCLEQAAATFAALGDDQRAAEAQVPQIVALAMTGRHDAALALGASTRERFIACGDGVAAGKVELNLASMLLRQDRYAEAATWYRGAALRFARGGDLQHSVMADIGLASALTWQFDFDEAARIYERAAQRARAHGLQALQGVIDNNRGSLELHRGRHAWALRHLVAALATMERQGSPQQQAESRRDLADAYVALGLWPEAEALYDQAIEAARRLGAPVQEAWAAVQRARVRDAQGADDAATQDLAAARALFSAHANTVGLGRVALHASALALRQGRAALALDEASHAAAAFGDAGVRGWQAEAEVLMAESLAALGRSGDAQARWQATLAGAAGLPQVQAACHAGIGHGLRAAGDRAGARRSFEQAVASTEEQRAALHGDEFQLAYGGHRRSAHEALVELALDDSDALALLEAMERARAQALRNSLAQADAEPEEPLPEREGWRWLHGQWRQALAAGDGSRAADLQQRTRRAESEWLEAARRARAAAAGGRSAGPAPALEPAALRAALGAGQALVEYVQLGERLAACVVTAQGVACKLLDGRDLDRRIESLRQQLDTLRHGASMLQRHADQLAERARRHLAALHAQLWAPLQPLLQGAAQVVVVPHRALHYVPFSALFDGQRYLAEHTTTSLAPSAALWLAAAQRPAQPPRHLLALGHGGTALPHVAAELQAVASAFPGRARTLQDDGATQAGLREHLAGADVLHLACHAEFRADSPYFSALHLADGPLTLRDAAALPLAVQLVTLSACETGLSTQAPGDEVLGLVRGFVLAGAPAVLATLWTVDDAATAELMGRFYRELCNGTPAAEALRRAQCEAMRLHPNPYFWAAFCLHGRS